MKNIKKYMLIIIPLFIIIINSLQFSTVLASNKGDEFITKSELRDANGNHKNNFEIGETAVAHYEFNIPDKVTIKAEDTMTVRLPKELIFANDSGFNLLDDLGNIVGVARLYETTGEVVISFTDYYEKNTSNRNGSFDIYTNWNREIVNVGEILDIDLGVGGETIKIIAPESPDESEKLFKWGWINRDDPTVVDWVVRINYEGNTINSAVYTDYIDINQILISKSINVSLGVFNGSDFIQDSNLDSSKIEESLDGKKFNVYYGDLTRSSMITYQTRITDDGAATEYKNNGSLTGLNVEERLIEVFAPNTAGRGNGSGKTPDPSTPDPSTPDPSTPDPSTPDPSTPDPSTPDPSTPDPSTPDPSTPDPSTPDPSTPDPSTPDPSTPDPSTPDPSTPDLSLEKGCLNDETMNDSRESYSLPRTGVNDEGLYLVVLGLCFTNVSILIWIRMNTT